MAPPHAFVTAASDTIGDEAIACCRYKTPNEKFISPWRMTHSTIVISILPCLLLKLCTSSRMRASSFGGVPVRNGHNTQNTQKQALHIALYRVYVGLPMYAPSVHLAKPLPKLCWNGSALVSYSVSLAAMKMVSVYRLQYNQKNPLELIAKRRRAENRDRLHWHESRNADLLSPHPVRRTQQSPELPCTSMPCPLAGAQHFKTHMFLLHAQKVPSSPRARQLSTLCDSYRRQSHTACWFVHLIQQGTGCMRKLRMDTASERPTRMPWARWPTDCTAFSTSS